MDKTFNDLMDIVNRSKRMDGNAPKKSSRPTKVIPEPTFEEDELIEKITQEVEDKPTPSSSSGSKLSSLISKARANKSSSTPKPAPKKPATPKSATPKPETKKETKPKADPKKVEKKIEKEPDLDDINDTIIEVDEAPKPSKPKTLKRNTDSTYENQLYEALQNSFYKGGTDVSEFMSEDEVLDEEIGLNEDKSKEKAEKINDLITREQQEYEQLFNGSLGSLSIDAEHKSEETVRPRLEIDGEMGTNRNNADSTFELNSGNSDLDMKIAEYYKRKQAKIEKFNKMEEEGYLDTPKDSTPKEEPVDYEAIFNGSMMSRDEALGIEPVETETEPEPVIIAEDTTQIDLEPTEFNHDNENIELNPVETTPEEPVEAVSIEPETTKIESVIPESPEEVLGVTEETPIVSNDEPTQEVTPTDNTTTSEVVNKNITPEPVTTDINTNPVSLDNKEERIKSALSDILFGNSPSVKNDEFMDVYSEQNNSQTPTNTDTTIPSSINPTEISLDSPVGVVTDSENVIADTEETITDKQDNNMYDLSSNTATFDDFVATGNIDENNNSIPENPQDIPVDNTQINSQPIQQENLTNTSESVQQENVNNISQPTQPTSIFDTQAEPVRPTISVEDKLAMDNYDMVIATEKLYEQNKTENNYVETPTNNSEDNTFVMNALPSNSIDILSAASTPVDTTPVTQTEVVTETPVVEETISKEEFYNEMARLQENLISELKGEKVETSSVDFFAEKKNTPDTKAENVANELINQYNAPFAGNETVANLLANENVPTPSEPEVKENPVVKETYEPKTPIIDESVVGTKAEPVDPANFGDYNLLNKDVALNNEDLAYQERKYEQKTTPVDNYFYMSPADKEKKTAEMDEYMTIYENNDSIKEVGDINIFKNIINATPSSEILKEQEESTIEENDENDEEVETIYTLMGIQKRTVSKEKEDMKVLYVTSECQPFVASGGLGDVAGSLPKAIAEKGGIDIRVILPLYGTIKDEYKDKFEYLGNFTVHLSWRQEYCGLFRYFSDGVTYYFIDNERYFKRDKLYGYYDDGERFAYFSKAIVEALPHLNFFPDIIHCNDWQSGLVSAYIKTGNWSDFRYYKIRNIYTIHNVEYQGVYGMENLKDLFGIDPRFRNDLEYNGDINITKAAIQYSDKFTTVSNSYCDNLKQPYCSRGLHHIIIRNEYKLSGIINGIDYNFYNPATDRHILKNYDSVVIENKVLNKKLWQDEIGLPVDGDTPMIAIVSRLVSHKGIDLIAKILPNLLSKDVQLIVVGTGDQKYVDLFKSLEMKYPTKVRAFVDSYSNELARKAYAASDIFLMPSKIEPCGLSQMIASRYGSIPIVREVGGLKDSIRDFGCADGGNGYTFTNYNPDDLEYQLNRAIKDYSNKSEWRDKMKICMTQDFTWKKPAEEYIKLYKSLSNN